MAKQKQKQPRFRKALQRAIDYCGGSYGSLASAMCAVGKPTNRSQIRNLMTRIDSMKADIAVGVELATGGAINRLEFFPELINDNPLALRTVKEMIRSKA